MLSRECWFHLKSMGWFNPDWNPRYQNNAKTCILSMSLYGETPKSGCWEHIFRRKMTKDWDRVYRVYHTWRKSLCCRMIAELYSMIIFDHWGYLCLSLSLYLHIYIWSWSKGPCRDSPLGRPPVLQHETRRTFFPEFAKEIIFVLAKDLAKDCWMRWFIIYLSFSFSRCEVRTFWTELWQ
jgi:hypothetical protein